MTITQTTIPARAWAELLLLATIWGASFLTMALALREIGPMTVVLHRVGWAAVLLWVLAWWRGLPAPTDWRIWGAFFVMGALNNVIPFGLIAWGQLHIASGLASILNATTALFGVLLAAVFFRDERLSFRRIAGVALGICGVIAIRGVDRLGALDPGALGQIAILGAAVSYALASIWGRRTLGGLPPVVAAAGMLTGSTVISFPLAVWSEGWPSLTLAAETWGSIGYFAVLGTAGAYLLYYRVLTVAGAGNLMLVTILIPPVAILLGWAVLDEALQSRAFLGFALIAAGLVVIDGRLLRRLRKDTPVPG